MVDFGGLDNGKTLILGVIALIGAFLLMSVISEESFESWMNPILGSGSYSYMSTTTYDYLSTTSYPVTTTTYNYYSTTSYPITTTTYYYPSTTSYPVTTTTYYYPSTTSYPIPTTTIYYPSSTTTYVITSPPSTTTTSNPFFPSPPLYCVRKLNGFICDSSMTMAKYCWESTGDLLECAECELESTGQSCNVLPNPGMYCIRKFHSSVCKMGITNARYCYETVDGVICNRDCEDEPTDQPCTTSSTSSTSFPITTTTLYSTNLPSTTFYYPTTTYYPITTTMMTSTTLFGSSTTSTTTTTLSSTSSTTTTSTSSTTTTLGPCRIIMGPSGIQCVGGDDCKGDESCIFNDDGCGCGVPEEPEDCTIDNIGGNFQCFGGEDCVAPKTCRMQGSGDSATCACLDPDTPTTCAMTSNSGEFLCSGECTTPEICMMMGGDGGEPSTCGCATTTTIRSPPIRCDEVPNICGICPIDSYCGDDGMGGCMCI